MKQLMFGLFFLAIIGCHPMDNGKSFVKVVFTNISARPLNWVTLKAGERELTVGVLISNKDSVLLDVNWSKVPDNAVLTFIDDQTKQPYKINVSLGDANKQIHAKKCHTVRIRILDYDKGEVTCE